MPWLQVILSYFISYLFVYIYISYTNKYSKHVLIIYFKIVLLYFTLLHKFLIYFNKQPLKQFFTINTRASKLNFIKFNQENLTNLLVKSALKFNLFFKMRWPFYFYSKRMRLNAKVLIVFITKHPGVCRNEKKYIYCNFSFCISKIM